MTHLILIFDDDESYVRKLIENSFEIWSGTIDYSDIYSISSYKIVATLPNFDQNLVRVVREYEQIAKEKELNFRTHIVDSQDLRIWSYKFGLIACSKWLMFGGVLLNNIPLNITGREILKIIKGKEATNTHLILKENAWLGIDYNMAIIKNQNSFDYLFRNAMRFPFPYEHKFEDIIKFLEHNCMSNEIFKIKI